MVEDKERPIGVTIVAVLGFIFGALGVLGGLLMLAGAGMFASMYEQSAAVAGGLVAAGGIAVLVSSIIILIVSWGLWVGKSWAWWLEVIFSGIGVLSIFGRDIAGAVISAIVLWYFFKPEVKEFFDVQVSFST